MKVDSAPVWAALGSGALCTVASLGYPFATGALFLLPLPLLVAAGRSRERGVAVACLLTAALCLGVWGPLVAVAYLATVGVPSLVSARALFKGCRIEVVLAQALFALATGIALLVASSGADPAALWSSLATSFDESFDRVLELYRQVGVAESQVEAIEASRADIVAALVSMVPAISIVLASFVWLANLWLSRRWSAWPQLQNLTCWQAPPHAIWFFIAAGFLMFTPLGTAARNVFLVMLGVYFLQGAAIVSYYLARMRVPVPLRGAVLVLAALEQILAVFVLLLGIFDLWGDFRRLGRRPSDALVESE